MSRRKPAPDLIPGGTGPPQEMRPNKKSSQPNSAVGALDVTLGADDMARIEKAMPAAAVAGDRYGAALMTHLDSEHAS